MTKRMWRDGLGEAGLAAGLSAGPFGSVPADAAAGDHAGEQPLACRPGVPPVVAQSLQQARGERDAAVLAALALRDADHHAPTVDVGRPQADGLGDAESGRVAGGQDDAVAEDGNGIQKGDDLLGAGDTGSLAGCFGVGRTSGMFQSFCSVTRYRKRSAATATAIEPGPRRLPVARRTWHARICSGPSNSEDFPKWRANSETCRMQVSCVQGDRLRTCMSSAMRQRRGVKGSLLVGMNGMCCTWQRVHPFAMEASCQARDRRDVGGPDGRGSYPLARPPVPRIGFVLRGRPPRSADVHAMRTPRVFGCAAAARAWFCTPWTALPTGDRPRPRSAPPLAARRKRRT